MTVFRNEKARQEFQDRWTRNLEIRQAQMEALKAKKARVYKNCKCGFVFETLKNTHCNECGEAV